MQFRHGTFPFLSLHFHESASINMTNLNYMIILTRRFFHVPRAGLALSGHRIHVSGGDRSLCAAEFSSLPLIVTISKF
jgi:hypothetical protein